MSPTGKHNNQITVRYQVFVSSTFKDLIEERREVVETVLEKFHFPIGMELFHADDLEQWKVIKNTIDNSDIYVLLIGHRYGSITKKGKKISYTEKEFDYALRRRREGNLKMLCFIRNRSVELVPDRIETDPSSVEKLSSFIDKVQSSNLYVKFWSTKEELAKQIAVSLPVSVENLDAKSDGKTAGWIKRSLSESQLHTLNRLEQIKRIFYVISRNVEAVNDDLEIYTIDKTGSCVIERRRTQYCNSIHTHSYIQYISDKESPNSRIEDIIELETGKTFEHLVYKNEKATLGFFILFDRQINIGETIKYRFKAYIENYLSDLIDKGQGIVEFQPFSKISFSNKKDIFIFPDIPIFKKLSVMLIQKKAGEFLNQKVKYKVVNNNKVFTIEYGQIDPGAIIKVSFKL